MEVRNYDEDSVGLLYFTGIDEFDTLAEALLWAVMFERGWIWTGEKFEKREGR